MSLDLLTVTNRSPTIVRDEVFKRDVYMIATIACLDHILIGTHTRAPVRMLWHEHAVASNRSALTTMCSLGAVHSHTQFTKFACPSITCSHSVRVVWRAPNAHGIIHSQPLTIVVPSNATESHISMCPSSVWVHSPVRTFHTRTVPSPLPVTSLYYWTIQFTQNLKVSWKWRW